MAYFGQRGPSRAGARGGADQFAWGSIKTDAYRDNYLGHSLMAPVGRWQKGKDLQWWSKNKNMTEADRKEEMKRIKAEEQIMMDEAMGKRAPRERAQILMEQDELREVLRRGTVENDIMYHDTERVQGLGFAPTKTMAGMEETRKINLDGEEAAGDKLEGTNDSEMWERVEPTLSPRGGSVPAPTSAQMVKESRKSEKKEKKEAKKAMKKEAKKAKKQEKKEARREHGRDRSREPRRDDGRKDRDRSRSRSRSGNRRDNRRDEREQRNRQRHDSDSD